MSLKRNGQLCVKGQIPVVATWFCCNPAIPASRHSAGRVRRVMYLTFEETTKKPPYKTTCSCKTINGTKSVITQNVPENVTN